MTAKVTHAQIIRADELFRKDVFVGALEVLGLIEFDPKAASEDALALRALENAWWAVTNTNATTGPIAILQALTDAGFTISRKP